MSNLLQKQTKQVNKERLKKSNKHKITKTLKIQNVFKTPEAIQVYINSLVLMKLMNQ